MGPYLKILLLACALAANPAKGDTLVLGGMGTGTLLMEKLAEGFHKTHPNDRVSIPTKSMGSGGALRALKAGQIDVAVAGRPLKPEELSDLPPPLEYARTPLGFAANEQSDHALDVTEAALVRIYSNPRPAWPNGKPLRLILRPENESDNLVLASLSPQIATALAESLRRPGMVYAKTDNDAISQIEKTPLSFGITSLATARLTRSNVRMLPFNAVMPSVENLKTGKYPLSKPVILATRGSPSPVVQRFLGYLQSPAALRLLADLGLLYTGKR